MSKVDRSWVVALLLIVGVLAGAAFVISRTYDDVVGYEQMLRSQIERQVVLQGDTLLVVSANYWSETYILSNGVEVALEIVMDNQL